VHVGCTARVTNVRMRARSKILIAREM
jgi:hypothetical protein